MQETMTEKIARLKALREARDGTPEQIRNRKKIRAAFENKIRMQAFDEYIACTIQYLETNPEPPIQTLTKILKTATKLMRPKRPQ